MTGRMTPWLSVAIGFSLCLSGERAVRAEWVGPEKHTLSIAAHVPPAIIYVIDPQGKRAGMDPDGPVNPTGGGRVINERENTGIEAQNIASDDPEDEGDGQATTAWMIYLHDVPAGEYVVVLKGLESGITGVHARGTRRGYLSPNVETAVLVSAGIERRLLVRFDPDRNLLTEVRRVVTAGDLSRDIDIACGLGQISSTGICQSLRAKAEAAAAALGRGNVRAASGSLKAFQAELSAQAGKHVHEPALTILREEAAALAGGGGSPTGRKKYPVVRSNKK